MTTSPFSPAPMPAVQVSAASDPVLVNLLSAWALTATDVAVTEAWAAQAARLAPEQCDLNRLLFAVFGTVLLPNDAHADFPAYLTALAAQPEAEFSARLVDAARGVADPMLRAQAEAWLTATAAEVQSPKQQVVAHLTWLWETLLAPEWQRHSHQLTRMTRAVNDLVFSQPQWQAIDPFDALRVLLQTEPASGQLAQLAGVQRMVLVWSPHLQTHCTRLGDGNTLWVVRTFDPQLLRRDPLRRAEVLSPLNALADETRLRILELLVEHGELRAQEIIAQLEGSQGNVSRHLKQLVGAGFVQERRAGDANKRYTYTDAGLRRLVFLLRQLLSSRNVHAVGQEAVAAAQLSQARAGAPPELRDLLDGEGRVTRWSSKLKEQEALLRYLVDKFEVERSYTEAETNALLQQWYLDADYVLVRRSLIDAGLLRRTRDGARYWRM